MKVIAVSLNELPAPYVNLYRELLVFIEDPSKLSQKILNSRDGERLEDQISLFRRVSEAISDESVKQELETELNNLSENLDSWMNEVVLLQELRESLERLEELNISSIKEYLQALKDLRRLSKLIKNQEMELGEEAQEGINDAKELFERASYNVRSFREGFINPRVEYLKDQLDLSDDPNTLRPDDYNEINTLFLELNRFLDKETIRKTKDLLKAYKADKPTFNFFNLIQNSIRELSSKDYIIDFQEFKKYRNLYNQYEEHLPENVKEDAQEIIENYLRLKPSLGDPDFKSFLDQYLEIAGYLDQEILGDFAVDWRKRKTGTSFELDVSNPNIGNVLVTSKERAQELIKERISNDKDFLELHEVPKRSVKEKGKPTRVVYEEKDIDSLIDDLESEVGLDFLIRKFVMLPLKRGNDRTQILKTPNYFFLLVGRV